MNTVALTGKDTMTLTGIDAGGPFLFTEKDMADGNCVEITYDANLATVKRGKNGNTIYIQNEQGSMATVVVRLVRGSGMDKIFNGAKIKQKADFPAWTLMEGTFIKKLGDGAGNVTADTYVLSGGIFEKNVGSIDSPEGDSNAAVSLYTLKFADAERNFA